ncbi:MAG: LysE family transporter [Cyclobacteriaceae bacterium]
MSVFQVLFVSFSVSYLGSIPPGTINVTTMQYALLGQKRSAFYFAIAASLVEFFYAGLTVQFQIFLSQTAGFSNYFQLIAGVAMIVLGVANLLSKKTKINLSTSQGSGRHGFKKGVILGLVNPLTIPFWLAITAYLQGNGFISLDGKLFWYYLIGISAGTFSLLLTVRSLGVKFKRIAENHFLVHQLPGIIFLLMGLWNLIGLLF